MHTREPFVADVARDALPVPLPSTEAGPTPDQILSRARQENFPVASRLLPRAQRHHLLAIYGFARLADELGDEVPGDRLAWLGWLERELARVYEGEPGHPLLCRLAPTVRACDLPRESFQQLIEANRCDQRVRRYPTYDALLDYCALSANPVGHLVLRVFRADTDQRRRFSDAICTGLQLVEHWQDVAEDLRRDRLYLPLEDLERFGCREDDLRAPVANASVRELMRFEVERARGLFRQGLGLVASLRGRARFATAAFLAGGLAALDGIERCHFDVLSGGVRRWKRDFWRRLAGVLWRGR